MNLFMKLEKSSDFFCFLWRFSSQRLTDFWMSQYERNLLISQISGHLY